MSHESDTPDWHNGATYDYNVEAIPGADVENIGEAMFRWLLKQDESKDDKGIYIIIYISTLFLDADDIVDWKGNLPASQPGLSRRVKWRTVQIDWVCTYLCLLFAVCHLKLVYRGEKKKRPLRTMTTEKKRIRR